MNSKKVDLKAVQACAEKFGNDVDAIRKEKKRISSVQTRLNKQKVRADYETEIEKVLTYYELLRQAQDLLEPKKKSVPDFNQADVDALDYTETMKAIKTIQSKKCNSAWLTDTYGDNDEFRNAVRVEEMLLAHKATVKPVAESYIRRSDLDKLIELIEVTADITVEKILELLKDM